MTDACLLRLGAPDTSEVDRLFEEVAALPSGIATELPERLCDTLNATARVLKERVPEVKLTSVAPPNRPVSSKIMGFANARINLTLPHIERSVLPPFVRGKKGFIRRPLDYDPPDGWVHPDKRP